MYKKDFLLYLALFNTFIGVLSFTPIIYNIHKTQNTSNFPYLAIFLNLIFNILWIVYGYLKNVHGTIFMGLAFTTIYIYILYVKLAND
tara:strand:- start:1084 stop:1347 length:264 start_codon:yes stop_codon:yes gene_type:complete